MDTLLELVTHWLPLIQGLAALASIAGAALSWKYAIKAQRAREEMTQNIISSGLVKQFEALAAHLSTFRAASVEEDGKWDWTAYRLNTEENKNLLEEALAAAKAADPYLRTKPEAWANVISALASASANPDPTKIEYACKWVKLTLAQLKVAASTREFAPGT